MESARAGERRRSTRLAAARHDDREADRLAVNSLHQVSRCDSASRARVLGAAQRLCGNAAVQRLVDAAPVSAQRAKVFHDARAALSWADFKGKAAPRSPLDAATFAGHTSLGWEAKVTKTGADWEATASIAAGSLDLRAFIDPNRSWVRKAKRAADLLRHEQGHFDIEHVVVEKGEAAIRKASVGATGTGTAPKKKAALGAAVADLKTTAPFDKLSDTDDTVNRAQDDYDDQTDHGTKAAEQARWGGQIQANLPAYPIP